MSQYSIIYRHKFGHRFLRVPRFASSATSRSTRQHVQLTCNTSNSWAYEVPTAASVRSASCSNSWCLNERLLSCWYGFFPALRNVNEGSDVYIARPWKINDVSTDFSHISQTQRTEMRSNFLPPRFSAAWRNISLPESISVGRVSWNQLSCE